MAFLGIRISKDFSLDDLIIPETCLLLFLQIKINKKMNKKIKSTKKCKIINKVIIYFNRHENICIGNII